jgi:hypothetical protein
VLAHGRQMAAESRDPQQAKINEGQYQGVCYKQVKTRP